MNPTKEGAKRNTNKKTTPLSADYLDAESAVLNEDAEADYAKIDEATKEGAKMETMIPTADEDVVVAGEKLQNRNAKAVAVGRWLEIMEKARRDGDWLTVATYAKSVATAARAVCQYDRTEATAERAVWKYDPTEATAERAVWKYDRTEGGAR